MNRDTLANYIVATMRRVNNCPTWKSRKIPAWVKHLVLASNAAFHYKYYATAYLNARTINQFLDTL